MTKLFVPPRPAQLMFGLASIEHRNDNRHINHEPFEGANHVLSPMRLYPKRRVEILGKSCGVNLDAVREVAAMRPAGEKFDWSRTWVAEMFLSESERKRRKEQIDRERGITPEIKRQTEIKAGVITSSVGVGLMIFLYVFMQGVILSGHATPGDAAILSRLWVAGVIPFFVGVALIINGWFVSKRQLELARQGAETGQGVLLSDGETPLLRSANTAEFTPPSFGVTEGTTKHLSSPSQKR